MEVATPYLKPIIKSIVNTLQLRRIMTEMKKVNQTIAQIVLPDSMEETVGVDAAAIKRKEAMEKKKEQLALRLETMKQAQVRDNGQEANVQRESYLVQYSSTFDDFNEMAIQFGCVMRFACTSKLRGIHHRI